MEISRLWPKSWSWLCRLRQPWDPQHLSILASFITAFLRWNPSWFSHFVTLECTRSEMQFWQKRISVIEFPFFQTHQNVCSGCNYKGSAASRWWRHHFPALNGLILVWGSLSCSGQIGNAACDFTCCCHHLYPGIQWLSYTAHGGCLNSWSLWLNTYVLPYFSDVSVLHMKSPGDDSWSLKIFFKELMIERLALLASNLSTLF